MTTAEDILAIHKGQDPLAYALSQFEIWSNARTALASGQSYKIEGGQGARQITRVKSDDIMKNYNFWKNKVETLSPDSTSQNMPKFHSIQSSGRR